MQTVGLNGREIEKKKKANNKDSRLNLFCGIYHLCIKRRLHVTGMKIGNFKYVHMKLLRKSQIYLKLINNS